MRNSTFKKRKRGSSSPGPKSQFSASLNTARDLVNSGKQAEGLLLLNELASATRNPTKLGKILLLIGDSQVSFSRHTEAVAAFERASVYAKQAQNYGLLLRAGYGQVRSLLRSLNTEQAKIFANQLIADLSAAERAIEEIARLTPAQLASQGSVTVPSRPPRGTVVLTKIGNAFYESGLTNEARDFYLQAIQLSPNGASRARQSLAKLSLASDNPELAERYARESLLMGRFQAKTVAAWQLYLDARARQKLNPILEPDVFAAFKLNTTGRIAGASFLSIIRVLRAHSDSQWKLLATEAVSIVATDPIVKTEIEKILQSDAKLTSSQPPEVIAAQALRMLVAPEVSAQEQIAHAKVYVLYTLKANLNLDTSAILQSAQKSFGPNHVISLKHAMALGAISARRFDLAREQLKDLESLLQAGCSAWGRCCWALARMEGDLGNHNQASIMYMKMAAHDKIQARFRVQGLLRGLHHLKNAGGSTNHVAISRSIRSIMSDTTDYRVALNAARQLALAGTAFRKDMMEAANRGIALADLALASSSTDQEALGITEFLARKLYWDLSMLKPLLQRWDNLSTQKKTSFAAIGGSIWYQYIATVFRSLQNSDRQSEALALAASILDENRASPEGYVIIGTEYAEWLLRSGDKVKAFGYFDWISTESPTHRKAALSHYWIAISNLQKNDLPGAKRSANAIRKCYSPAPALEIEQLMDAAALLILNDYDKFAAQKDSIVPQSIQTLQGQIDRIQEDIDSL